jgi:hypothetical protein
MGSCLCRRSKSTADSPLVTRAGKDLPAIPPRLVCQDTSGDAGMSGKFIQRGSEAGAQTPTLLRASSPLKPKNQPRTNIETGTAHGGTSVYRSNPVIIASVLCLPNEFMLARLYLYSLWKGRT